jgi:hypothetical protein
MYFTFPMYQKDFAPVPVRNWERLGVGEGDYYCTAGKATLRVFQVSDEENAPWWAECENPDFESEAGFYTAEQAMYWAENEIAGWFN